MHDQFLASTRLVTCMRGHHWLLNLSTQFLCRHQTCFEATEIGANLDAMGGKLMFLHGPASLDHIARRVGANIVKNQSIALLA